RVGRRVHAHLTASTDEWAARGRDVADLYRGGRLSAAFEIPSEELTMVEREFLEASRARAGRELRRLRTMLACVVVLLAAAVVAGVVALHKSRTASTEERAALAGQLGSEAETEPRIDRAMLLA